MLYLLHLFGEQTYCRKQRFDKMSKPVLGNSNSAKFFFPKNLLWYKMSKMNFFGHKEISLG